MIVSGITIGMTNPPKNQEEALLMMIDSLAAAQLELELEYEEEYWRWQRFAHFCRTGRFPN